ncbi:phenylalanine--tRNA ligase alpha subunit B-like [Uloborus diversus]|uniref:phenylalanine--tRNA ligase alpha subunit B-like n=1 Tax=Uloborus diversus TaxID=327109 RepID=UPI002409570E|nr:phenylalanine--tRNA ligase alpha subunit B-like [Uloborus diversus]
MTELVEEILMFLKDSGEEPVDSLRLAESFQTDHQKVVGAIKSLQSAGNLIDAEQKDTKSWKLTPEGEKVATNGSYEALVFYSIPPEGISQQQIMKSVPQANVGFSKAMSSGWIYIEKKDGATMAFRKVYKSFKIKKYVYDITKSKALE